VAAEPVGLIMSALAIPFIFLGVIMLIAFIIED
jgi:hypothetical protein